MGVNGTQQARAGLEEAAVFMIAAFCFCVATAYQQVINNHET